MPFVFCSFAWRIYELLRVNEPPVRRYQSRFTVLEFIFFTVKIAFLRSDIPTLSIYLFEKFAHHPWHTSSTWTRKRAKHLPYPRNSCGSIRGFVFHQEGIPRFKNLCGYPGAPRNEKLSVRVKRIQHRWMEVARCAQKQGFSPYRKASLDADRQYSSVFPRSSAKSV